MDTVKDGCPIGCLEQPLEERAYTRLAGEVVKANDRVHKLEVAVREHLELLKGGQSDWADRMVASIKRLDRLANN